MKINPKLISLYFISIIILVISAFVNYYPLRQKTTSNVAGVNTLDTERKTVGGLILPHHGVAKDLLDKSYLSLSVSQQYSYIVILAPNHFAPEKNPFLTADSLAETAIADEFIRKLLTNLPGLGNAPEIMGAEHAVTLHLSYLEKYFPRAKIIPLIFSPGLSSGTLDNVADKLTTLLPQDTLYLLSLDFSHNSKIAEGLAKNEETISVFWNFNYQKLLSFNDDHLDSVSAAYVFLKIMQKTNNQNFNLINNSHSGILLEDPSNLGTSYVIGAFSQ